MPLRRSPIWKWVGLALLVSGGIALNIWWSWPDSDVHIWFCDVGQGDATLITHRFTQVLVDSGRDNQVQTCLNQALPWWDRHLELVVATHADADHIGGFPIIFNQYQVQHLMLSEYGKQSEDYHAFRTGWIYQRQSHLTRVFRPESLHQWRDAAFSLTVLSPLEHLKDGRLLNDNLSETLLSAALQEHEATIENYNDGSIVLLLEVGGVDVLLAGDLEKQGEQALIRAGLTKDIDILKVGHHGSKTSTTLDFLQRLRPEIAIISCGKNNEYGHPHPSILDNLDHFRSKILRTDQLGTIEVISDGENYWFGSAVTD